MSGALPELDLRLAVGAAAAWVMTLCCLGRSAATVGVVAAAAVLAGGLGLLLGRCGAGCRWHAVVARAGPALALACCCCVLVLVPLVVRLVRAQSSPLVVLARQHAAVDVVVRVTADPQRRSGHGLSGTAGINVAGSVRSVARDGAATRPVPAGGDVEVIGTDTGWADVIPGQSVRLRGTLLPSTDAGLSVVVLARGPPALIGTPPWWQRAAQAVRLDLRRACRGLGGDVSALLPGLVDGDTSDLSPVVSEEFRAAGLSHLVAVSGTNCTIVLGCVLVLARRCGARRWQAALAGAVVLLGFVLVARPTPSVLRAAAMAAVALVALGAGRRRAGLPMLSAAALILLAWHPLLAGSASFAMSALATAALIIVAPGWADALRRRRVPLVLAVPVAVAAAAHVATAPVAAAISGQVSLVAIPANVLAEPVVGIVTVLGFAAAAVAPWWPAAAHALVRCAAWPCRWLLAVARFFGTLPGSVLPWPAGTVGAVLLAAVCAVLVLGLYRRATRTPLLVAVAIAALIQIPIRSVVAAWPPPGAVLVACAVGQGDGLFVPVGPGRAVVVDTGPEPIAIDRCLREFGIDDIALLVLTHDHGDHVGGVDGALHGRRVEGALTSPLPEPAGGYHAVTAALSARGVAPTVARPGQVFVEDSVRVDVLGPTRAYRGTRSDPNNSAVVVRITVRGVRLLMTGDAEVDAQEDMLAAGVDLRADVLKVPHHGSAYFSPTFLAAVRARVAVISVGAHNDYGHPAPSLLAALARLGLAPARTDTDGDVAVTGAGDALRVVVHGRADGRVPVAMRGPPAASQPDVRMGKCPPAPSPSTTCPRRSPPSSCWSGTRSYWSVERSARSPPRRGEPIPAWW